MKKYLLSERNELFEPNVYISVVIRLAGDASCEAVTSAVKNAYAANESTMSKIVLEQNGDAYYERMEQSGCKVAVDERPWQDIVKASEKAAFDLKNGELIRTYIIPDDGGATLLIHAHHLVGDGKSIVLFSKDILNSLAGKTLEYKPMQLIDRPYLEKRTSPRLYVRLFIKGANRRWRKAGRSFSWEDYDAIHRAYWQSHTSAFELETHSVSELKKRCTNGATINSLLVTKLLEARTGSAVVGIPISVKEGEPSMSNQTSGISVKCKYDREIPFEQNLQRVHKAIYKKLNDKRARYAVLMSLSLFCPSLLDAVVMQSHGCYDSALTARLIEIMGYGQRKTSDIGLTNLGIIDIPQDLGSFQTLDFLFIPPKISYTKDVYGAAAFGDRLTVCRHSMEAR